MLSLIVVGMFMSCHSDNDNWETYKEWRNANAAWLERQADSTVNGKLYYESVRPEYDKGQYIYMHWFNDRNATKNNLQPYYTSTVDVKYIGYLYNGEPFDSSYNNTATYGDSLFRTSLRNVISGWAIALQEMHVGDSVEVLIPYQSAYGASGSGSIPPYSNLKFGVKLVNVPFWEIEE